MPSDIERYKPMVAEFLESGKAIAGDIIRDASASIPFTQRSTRRLGWYC